MSTFREYDPVQSLHAAPPKACEECHARKVRCIPSGRGQSCIKCLKQGIDCKPRSRKRKRVQQNGEQQSSPRRQASRAVTHPTSWQPEQASEWTPPLLFSGNGTRASADASPLTSSTIDRFHNSSFLCRTAILGQDFHDIDHTNGGTTARNPEHTLSSTDLETLKLHNAFELPDYPERQSLIDVFFDKCWAFMPVVDRLGLDPTETDSSISYLLLQAVLLAGRNMRPHRYPASMTEVLYRRLKALVYSGHERSPLDLVAALCLIQWSTAVAPKDITQDSPRYWTTMAVGIAQQMGLHRKSTSPRADDSLRRRIWWTLCARDNLSASAQGRPRLINPLDCDQPPLTTADFPDSADEKSAKIFMSYVSILQILGDLCQCIVRKGEAAAYEKEEIAARLMAFLDLMPSDLKLVDARGSPTPYNLHVAQLHIPILATILILYRPKSVFTLTSANAASVAAANLSFRIFEAIELREHTHCLSSVFSWHLLMTCVPLVSSLGIHQLRDAAQSALDCLEKSFDTLGKTRPSAANNLRSVRSIRKAMTSSLESGRGRPSEVDSQDQGTHLSMASGILNAYGSEAVRHYEKLFGQLGTPSANDTGNGMGVEDDFTLPSQHQQDFLDLLGIGDAEDQFNFDDLFGPGHSWMMRDWVTGF